MAAVETANKFNDFINARDISGLSDMMADNHIFIDMANKMTAGKENCVKAWEAFFNAYPDYRNHFTKFTTKGKFVLIEGHSTCCEKLLEGPALWTAKIDGDKVSVWRVYEDTKENRSQIYK